MFFSSLSSWLSRLLHQSWVHPPYTVCPSSLIYFTMIKPHAVTLTYMQIHSHVERFSSNFYLRLHKHNTHGTATGHIQLPLSSKRRYSDNLPAHLMPHEWWASRILKRDSNLSANRSSWQRCTPDSVALLLLSESAHGFSHSLAPSCSSTGLFNHSERREIDWGNRRCCNILMCGTWGASLGKFNTGQSGQEGEEQGAEAGKRLSGVVVLRDSGKMLWGQWG